MAARSRTSTPRTRAGGRGLSPVDRLKLEKLLQLRELRRRADEKARARSSDRWATPGAMAAELDPDTVQTPALDLIDQALADVAEGRNKRLIISIGPQEGKSQRVSRRFPLWLLNRNPALRIVIASYERGVARRWGRTIKQDIAQHADTLGLRVSDDSSAAHEWQLDGHDGGVYCVGIGGALTGRPADCLRGDSLITTEHGYVAIRDLHRAAHRPRVLTVDHSTGLPEWRDIVATRAIPDRPLVEVITEAGRRIVCTPDHRVYTAGRGYVAAIDLDAGDRLVAASGGRHDLQRVRPAVPEAATRSGEVGPGWAHPGVLHQAVQQRHHGPGDRGNAAVRDVREDEAGQEPQGPLVLAGLRPGGADGGRDVRALPEGVHVAPVRAHQAGAPGRGDVLLAGVRRGGSAQSRVPVSAMREADRLEGPRSAVLLEGVPARDVAGRQGTAVSAVRPGVLPGEFASGVLRPDVRERGARSTDDRAGQLPVQERHELRTLVPADAAADLRAGRAQVRGVQGAGPALPGHPGGEDVDADQLDRSPLERAAAGQLAGEPDHAVQDVPRRAPQVGDDTVVMVRQLRGQRDTVYDLQVDGNHNFFADQVLVHNCMIIDDPHKGRKEADSAVQRETVWDWWTETARTRFGVDTPVIVIATRWHEDDLSGRLIEQDRNGWTVINIPARADHNPEAGETDPLGREPGEYLESTRGRHLTRPIGKCTIHPDGIRTATGEHRPCCDWDDIERAVGSRGWEALYQGNPSPSTGAIFKRKHLIDNQYDSPQWIEREDGSMWAIGFDQVIASWDMAFKDTDGSDGVCGQIWGRRGLDAYLLDQVYERMDFVATCQAVRELAARWPQATLKLVEDKANGTAVINQLRRTVSGLVPVEPTGSKVARASAVSPFVEAGQVHLPSPELAPWVGALIKELTQFPTSPNDDRTDTFGQGIDRLLLDPLVVDDEIREDDEDGPPEGSISAY